MQQLFIIAMTLNANCGFVSSLFGVSLIASYIPCFFSSLMHSFTETRDLVAERRPELSFLLGPRLLAAAVVPLPALDGGRPGDRTLVIRISAVAQGHDDRRCVVR